MTSAFNAIQTLDTAAGTFLRRVRWRKTSTPAQNTWRSMYSCGSVASGSLANWTLWASRRSGPSVYCAGRSSYVRKCTPSRGRRSTDG
eukprot:2978987-Pyramimonas_sp.AAC.1